MVGALDRIVGWLWRLRSSSLWEPRVAAPQLRPGGLRQSVLRHVLRQSVLRQSVLRLNVPRLNVLARHSEIVKGIRRSPTGTCPSRPR